MVAQSSKDSALLKLRGEKFAALATLLRTDTSGYVAAIEKLMQTCPGIPECPARAGYVGEAAKRALDWATEHPDSGEIELEHISLFGSEDMVTSMPQIAAYASMYAGSDSNEVAESVECLYDSMGFGGPAESRCPTRMDIELDFAAFLLGCASRGDADALLVARDFLTTHLFTWGIVFSAATFYRADHPVTRFAGMMLEHMLFCEAEQAKGAGLAYRALGGSAEDTFPCATA